MSNTSEKNFRVRHDQNERPQPSLLNQPWKDWRIYKKSEPIYVKHSEEELVSAFFFFHIRLDNRNE